MGGCSTVGLGQFEEIRVSLDHRIGGDLGANHAVFDFAQLAIVPDNDGKGEVQLHRHGKFLHGVLEAVVTEDSNGGRVGFTHPTPNRAADCRSQGIAQGAKAVRVVPMAGAVHRIDLLGGIGELGHVGIDHGVGWQGRFESVSDRQDTGTFSVDFSAPLGALLGDIISRPFCLKCLGHELIQFV